MSSSTTVETAPAEATETPADASRGAATKAESRNESPAPANQPPAGAERWARQRKPLLTMAMVQRLADRLAGLIRVAGMVAAALLVLGIVFTVLDANAQKWLVSDVENAGRWLATPFRQTFQLHDKKLALALNWGIPVVIYPVLARVVAKLIAGLPERLGRRG